MHIREATLDDQRQVDWICDASNRERWTPGMITPVNGRVVLAAAIQGEIVGVAKTHFYGEPDGEIPAGHYLGGLVVTPEFRRRGIGSALTRSRMDWIWSQASSVYYFANEHNEASIEMHQPLGFQPVGRFTASRGVTADNGRSELVLFEASP